LKFIQLAVRRWLLRTLPLPFRLERVVLACAVGIFREPGSLLAGMDHARGLPGIVYRW